MYRITEQMLAAAGMQRYEISNYALPGYECRHNIGYWTGVEYAGFGLGASSLLGLSRKSYQDHCDKGSEMSGHAQGKKQVPPASGAEQAECGFTRFRNPENMQAYLAGDFSGREVTPLSPNDRMEEFMFLGLRMTKGISEREFQKRFGKSVEEVYGGVLKKYCADGLLKREGDRIALTARGLDLSNTVMADFLLE